MKWIETPVTSENLDKEILIGVSCNNYTPVDGPCTFRACDKVVGC